MRIGAIDIGTNTVLLLVADFDRKGRLEPVHDEQRVPRLGRDVDNTGVIQIPAYDRVAWILNEYKNVAQQMQSERIVACATSAVRNAANRPEFLSYLKRTTGLSVEVISGEEEALGDAD
jgi:exopolyphosphatase/guanosine-5'-triphosphate,3'-diphosphate pyrophosphatase